MSPSGSPTKGQGLQEEAEAKMERVSRLVEALSFDTTDLILEYRQLGVRLSEAESKLAKAEGALDQQRRLGGRTSTKQDTRRRIEKFQIRRRLGLEWFESLRAGTPPSEQTAEILDFFHSVARELGYQPNGTPAKPPVIRWQDQGRDTHPTPFWDTEEDGGAFPERAEVSDEIPPIQELDPSFEIQHPEELVMGEIRPDPNQRSELITITADSMAFYYPWRYGGDDHWGIYFRVPKMQSYIRKVEAFLGEPMLGPLLVQQVFEHEMEHFYQERAATTLSQLLGSPLDEVFPDGTSRSLTPVVGGPVPTVRVEEALATAREVEIARWQEGVSGAPDRFAESLEALFIDRPPGYRSFFLCTYPEGRAAGRADFLGAIQTEYFSSPTAADRFFEPRLPGFPVPVRFVFN